MKTLSIAILALCSLFWRHKPTPEVTGFYPGWGYPGQIIKVEGTDLGRPTIHFNGRPIPCASVSDIYFQIPRDARAGNHPVQLVYGSRRLPAIIFEVRSLPRGLTWPRQRIEDIAINTMTPELRSIKLAVSVANGDSDSRVKILILDDLRPQVVCDPCATEFFSAISSDFFNQADNNPATYGYPVYHYTSLLVTIPSSIEVTGTTIMGRTLLVEIINRDGSRDMKNYKVPISYEQLDSDNDGLLDSWETTGYPLPSNPDELMNIREMGCNPYRKDILVEVDWMPHALPDSFIRQNLWERISEVYLKAPVLNPDGSSGIHLHIDRGQDRVAFGSPSIGPFTEGHTPILDFDYLDFGRRPAGLTGTYISFCTLKSRWFDADRNDIFHYCVIGNAGGNLGSGRAESPGNGFIVTTVRLPNPVIAGSVEAMIGSFVHELGHNLGLHHGGLITDPPIGFTSTNPYDWQPYVLDLYKPNQPSSMNYRYHLKGISHDCDLCADVPAVHGYSEGMMRDINEATVNELAGICNNRSIDFLFDGILSTSVRANTNGVHPPGADPLLCIGHSGSSDVDSTDVFHDYDEWGNLQLNWRASRLFQDPPRWWWGCR